MVVERWRGISGIPGYQVSSHGNVANKQGQLIRCRSHTSGYRLISLFLAKGGRAHRLIHRLVAQAFIPNPENKPEVNHMNGDKTDNRVENLEWSTHFDNMQHAHKAGLINRSGIKCNFAKLTESQISLIRLWLSVPGVYQRQIGDSFGVTQSNISYIKSNKTWRGKCV